MTVLENHTNWPVVKDVCKKLNKHGFKAYLAGGCVRDGLLGLPPNDFDVATDAPVEQLEKLFQKTVLTGKAFGVIKVIIDKVEVDIARFRSESDYEDGRHPIKIQVCTPKEDAKRRDFTINSMFYDLQLNQIIDYYGGQKDLDLKLIRAVGEAEKRFNEDHLRALRALRFSAQLDFDIEKQTFHALFNQVKNLKKISKERVLQELKKAFASDNPNKAIYFLSTLNYWPNLLATEINQLDLILMKIKYLGTLNQGKIKHYFYPFFIYFSFKLGLSKPVCKDIFTNLRFSNAEIKTYFKQFEALYMAEKTNLSLGEKLSHLTDKKLVELLKLLVLFNECNNIPVSEINHVIKNYTAHYARVGELPGAIVKAEDLISHFKGEKLGQKLKQAYYLQLENPSLNKQELLNKLNI